LKKLLHEPSAEEALALKTKVAIERRERLWETKAVGILTARLAPLGSKNSSRRHDSAISASGKQ